MLLATAVDPVNITPFTLLLLVMIGPIVEPTPKIKCNARLGIPAWYSIDTIAAATIQACSAGFAITVLPATNAAATCPVKIAKGKFHGLIQATSPSGL